MEITGRVTRDAVVTALKDERSVINFNVAISEGYRDKQGTWIDRTEFVRCSFWLNQGAAKLLRKGALVQLYGRMSAHAWQSTEGEPKAELRFHTSAFKVVSVHAPTAGKPQQPAGDVDTAGSAQDDDDLPF